MLELKIKDKYESIIFNDKEIVENFTFVDDPNKIMCALIDLLSNRKEISVANICDDYSDNIFVFISNPWEEKIIIIKNNESQNDEIVVSKFIDIKKLAKTFLNSDLKKYIENHNTENCYKELSENVKRLELAIETGETIYSTNKQLNNLKGYIFQKNRTCGSYAEFQYCDSKSKEISNWKSDSLYIDIGSVIHNDIFYPNYFRILNVAKLSNGEIGFDPFGENYYSPEQTKTIYEQIEKDKNLPDRKVLLDWLKVAVEKNIGFYILGA